MEIRADLMKKKLEYTTQLATFERDRYTVMTETRITSTTKPDKKQSIKRQQEPNSENMGVGKDFENPPDDDLDSFFGIEDDNHDEKGKVKEQGNEEQP